MEPILITDIKILFIDGTGRTFKKIPSGDWHVTDDNILCVKKDGKNFCYPLYTVKEYIWEEKGV